LNKNHQHPNQLVCNLQCWLFVDEFLAMSHAFTFENSSPSLARSSQAFVYEDQLVSIFQGCSHRLFPQIIVLSIKDHYRDHHTGSLQRMKIVWQVRFDDKPCLSTVAHSVRLLHVLCHTGLWYHVKHGMAEWEAWGRFVLIWHCHFIDHQSVLCTTLMLSLRQQDT